MNAIKFLLLIIACITMQNTYALNKKVEGNKKVITKSFPISDYDKIEIEGSMEFDYTQSNTTPKLEITLDENLFDYLDIYVKERTLVIKKKKDFRNINVKPTSYKVVTNSFSLRELTKAGSGTFNFVNKLNTTVLAINFAGSGKIVCKDGISVSNLNVDAVGSGSIVLKGEINQAIINLSGSGDIGTYGCSISSLDCNIAGSGNIKATVHNYLSCNIVGGGNLMYKGNPQLEQNIIGSGKINGE